MHLKLLPLAVGSLIALTSARAVPTLQLDIVHGEYNRTDETTYATTPQFTLRALLKSSAGTSGTYYISAAIQPLLDQTNPPPNVGTFSVDGKAFATSAMNYGMPPVDVTDTGSGNLPRHGEFPTYYAEIPFTFDALHTVGAYNTQDGGPSSGILYYHDFAIDVTGLLAGNSIHFDLYDEKLKTVGGGSRAAGVASYSIDDFAPFSHDAQSGPTNNVPDAETTLILLGMALAGLAATRRIVLG